VFYRVEPRNSEGRIRPPRVAIFRVDFRVDRGVSIEDFANKRIEDTRLLLSYIYTPTPLVAPSGVRVHHRLSLLRSLRGLGPAGEVANKPRIRVDSSPFTLKQSKKTPSLYGGDCGTPTSPVPSVRRKLPPPCLVPELEEQLVQQQQQQEEKKELLQLLERLKKELQIHQSLSMTPGLQRSVMPTSRSMRRSRMFLLFVD